MSKYEPLTAYLRNQPFGEVRVGFGDLEKILGFKLPSSAGQHRAWWSNNGSNNVMTKAWLSAGFRTRDVDMENERLTFERVDAAASELRIAACGARAAGAGRSHPRSARRRSFTWR